MSDHAIPIPATRGPRHARRSPWRPAAPASAEPPGPVTGTGARPLDARAVHIWKTENALATAAALAIAGYLFTGPLAGTGAAAWGWPAVLTVLCLAVVEWFFLIPRRYRFHRFALTEDSIAVVRGRVLRREHVFPLRQILYVEARQGPLLRRYGLFTIHIGTLGEPHRLGPVSLAIVEEFRWATRKSAPGE
jgi:uncharacterized protein